MSQNNPADSETNSGAVDPDSGSNTAAGDLTTAAQELTRAVDRSGIRATPGRSAALQWYDRQVIESAIGEA